MIQQALCRYLAAEHDTPAATAEHVYGYVFDHGDRLYERRVAEALDRAGGRHRELRLMADRVEALAARHPGALLDGSLLVELADSIREALASRETETSG